MILEELEGICHKIDGDTTYVTLRRADGAEEDGELPTAFILANGVRERRRFTWKMSLVGKNIVTEIADIPDKVISEERLREIKEQVEDDKWKAHEEGDDLIVTGFVNIDAGKKPHLDKSRVMGINPNVLMLDLVFTEEPSIKAAYDDHVTYKTKKGFTSVTVLYPDATSVKVNIE